MPRGAYRPYKHLSDQQLVDVIRETKEYLQRYHPPRSCQGNEDARRHNQALNELEEEQELRRYNVST